MEIVKFPNAPVVGNPDGTQLAQSQIGEFRNALFQPTKSMHSFAILANTSRSMQWLKVTHDREDFFSCFDVQSQDNRDVVISDVIDWLYVHNNRLIGGFTFRHDPSACGWNWADYPFFFATINTNELDKQELQLFDSIGDGNFEQFEAIVSQITDSQRVRCSVAIDNHPVFVDDLSLLLYAVYEENEKVLDYILKLGANESTCDKFGYKAIHIAASRKQPIPLIEKLLSAGFYVDEPTKGGFTALCIAAALNDVATIRFLLGRGANIDYYAVKQLNRWEPPVVSNPILDARRIEALELLLQNGAQCDARDATGRTAFHVAVANRSFENAILLLQYGADPDVIDLRGIKPVDELDPDVLKSDPSCQKFLEILSKRREDLAGRARTYYLSHKIDN